MGQSSGFLCNFNFRRPQMASSCSLEKKRLCASSRDGCIYTFSTSGWDESLNQISIRHQCFLDKFTLSFYDTLDQVMKCKCGVSIQLWKRKKNHLKCREYIHSSPKQCQYHVSKLKFVWPSIRLWPVGENRAAQTFVTHVTETWAQCKVDLTFLSCCSFCSLTVLAGSATWTL